MPPELEDELELDEPDELPLDEPPVVAALPLEDSVTAVQKPLTHCWLPGHCRLVVQAGGPLVVLLPPELLPPSPPVGVPPPQPLPHATIAATASVDPTEPNLPSNDPMGKAPFLKQERRS